MAARLRIAMAQLNLLVGGVEQNVQRIQETIIEARDRLHAQVVVFPELALTGYPPEDLLLRPEFQMQVLAGFARIQQQVTGIDVIVGYSDPARGGLYNAASVIREQRILGTYHKQHLPNYSVFDEKRYFAAGSAPCVVEMQGCQVGITVCEDIWMAEPARQCQADGAQLIININASPYHVHKQAEREQAVRQRTRETALPVLYLNMVGGQDELVFDGQSFVMNAKGDVTQRAPGFVEGLYLAEFEVTSGALTPVAAVCQPEYSLEESVYQALVLGVRDYIEKNRFYGVVLGLSGGIDSALTLAIAVDALGKERVEAVMMPSQYTADMSLEDAETQARALGVEYRVLPIKPLFDAFLGALRDEFAGTAVDSTEENLQARCRGVVLMAISNKKRKIVLTTGNKSEMAVGYATLYGDMAGGFDVLKDVPKTLVYRLARYRNGRAPVIPQRVLDRAPSAELAPDQKDQDTLPDYAVLDRIIEAYVEQDRSVEDMIRTGLPEQDVLRTVRMIDANEYKRRQAPPGVRITRRAFGRDRRYPITSGYTLGARLAGRQRDPGDD